jgi:ParB family transcriptional regulator, chromosome partitioning protein
MSKSRGLGRGLAALIPSAAGGVDEVDIASIVPNPQQPRAQIHEETLVDLVESIREHGVLQPLLVSSGETHGSYQLIAGERRLRAARLAGLEKVPVLVKEAASRESLEIALVENIQREDLNALEEAQAYRRLADEFGMTQEAIAKRVGRSRTAVSNSMRLLGLSDEIKQSLGAGAITEGHARALLGLEDGDVRRRAWRTVVEQALSVRETEELVRRWSGPPPELSAVDTKRALRVDPDTAQLAERVRTALGTKVDLRRNAKGRGKLVLHFYSDEELESILGRLGVGLG